MGDQRRQNLTTASLQVFVHTNRFRIEDAQHFATQSVQLPVATADTGKLTSAALRGIAAIWRQVSQRFHVRITGRRRVTIVKSASACDLL